MEKRQNHSFLINTLCKLLIYMFNEMNFPNLENVSHENMTLDHH